MADRTNVSYCSKCQKSLHHKRTTAHAARKAMIANGKHTTKPGGLNVYRCPHAKGWHVGHSSSH